MQNERDSFYHAFALFCLSPGMQQLVLAYFCTVKEAVTANDTDWDDFLMYARESGGRIQLTENEEKKIAAVRKSDYAENLFKRNKEGIFLVTEESPDYPAVLSRAYDHPHWLYYRGKLPDNEEALLSVIGARKCTPYGSATARCFSKELSSLSVGIVSGMAYGVDRAAHEGAIAGGGKTYAVLGNGVDICYPQTNFDIYEKICEGNGAVISEYPPGTRPLPAFFPQRNRIIAGMADGILVTEARKKSGTLITVAFALEYGKNIYAVPGRVTDPLSEGCNHLLTEGARPVQNVNDILLDMNWMNIRKNQTVNRKNLKKNEKILASPEKIVYASLRLRPKHVEELLEETKFSVSELSNVLHSLCLGGYIKRIGQALYAVCGEEKEFLPER